MLLFPTYAKSVAVEFRDYVGSSRQPRRRRIRSIMTALKRWPYKPSAPITRTPTSPTSGMRTFAAEGATIITHHANIPYFQALWANPRTIAPDRLSKSGRTPTFEGVVGNRMLSDGSRRLTIHHYPGNMHNPGMLMIYLPKEKILIEADSSRRLDAAHGAAQLAGHLQHFYDSVQRLQLDFETCGSVHGRGLRELSRGDLERFGDQELTTAPRREEQHEGFEGTKVTKFLFDVFVSFVPSRASCLSFVPMERRPGFAFCRGLLWTSEARAEPIQGGRSPCSLLF